MYIFKKGYYADIRIEERTITRISYVNEKLETAIEREENMAFIRVFNGSLWCYASITDIDHIQDELDRLYTMIPENLDIDNNEVVKRYEVNKDKVINFADNSYSKIPLKTKRELCEGYFETLRYSDYGVISHVLYSDTYKRYRFISSKGAELEYDWQLGGIACMKSMMNGEEKRDMMFLHSASEIKDLYGHQDELKESIIEHENALLNSIACEQGVFPVILSPKVTGVFAHESFGHKSESDFMLGDETLKKEWVIGKKVGHDILSIYDSGEELNNGSGYVPYDDEGTKARKNYLVKNGVLAGRLHSVTTAAELDENVTGNARAINCNYEPIVRMTSTIVGPGENTFEELVGRIKKGYFIKSYKHGSGLSTFTIAPELAYEIVDGKLGKPVKIAVITGNVFETLNLIDGASRETEVFSSVFGGCGKMEQGGLPVAMGGPYLSISKMNVM